MAPPATPLLTAAPVTAPRRVAARPRAARAALRARTDRPLLAGLIALAGWVSFVLLRLGLAAGGDITRFVRAARPYAHRNGVPPGLLVFPGNGYDGQFYYRLALDPANLHRTAFGITMDSPFRLQRIGYPALAWIVSAGQHAWVPVALVAVNVLALAAVGLAGGTLARDAGRHALCGLLLAGYFGFFMSVGNDLTEPVAAACLLGGIIACRRGRPVLAGAAFGYGTLTRETVLLVPLALGLARLISWARRAARPGAAGLAWAVPVMMFAAWQLVLRQATGSVILMDSAASNSSPGLPFSQFAGAIRMNLGLLWPPTGAAWIWCLEVAVLAACTAAALAALRAPGPRYERLAFLLYVVELGGLSANIWSGHADLRSIDEVYLLGTLILLGSRRRLGWLAAATGLALVVAGAHQALHLS
ncbi:MAG TPA: hypothetical protein VIF35_11380 [Streptosporangiaceae bacterium]|jgi:hypothetical protein